MSEEQPRHPAHGLTLEEVRRRVRESRAAQGLPPTVEDPVVLGKIVALIRRGTS